MASRPKRTILQEGPEAAWRFEHAMGEILRVSKEDLAEREAKYQETRKTKARPGPKSTKR